MRAELRAIQPNDYDDWKTFAAAERPFPCDDHGWFTLDIGVEGRAGIDMFQVNVATPAAASRARNPGEREFHGFIVESFEPEMIARDLRALVTSVAGSDWENIVEQLRLHMQWEYEGMNPPSGGTT